MRAEGICSENRYEHGLQNVGRAYTAKMDVMPGYRVSGNEGEGTHSEN